MVQSTARLILPARDRTDDETDAAQAPILSQRQEDLCLIERVRCALRATGHTPLRGVAVTAHTGFVILGGRVPSYYLKQIAQTIALAVPGARSICNDLDVARPQHADAR